MIVKKDNHTKEVKIPKGTKKQFLIERKLNLITGYRKIIVNTNDTTFANQLKNVEGFSDA